MTKLLHPSAANFRCLRAVCIFFGVFGTTILSVVPARAASVEAVTQTFSFIPTDWNDSVDLPLFDGTLGTLTGIEFNLETTVGGSIAYESQDGSPQTITLNLGSEITVEAPVGLTGVSDLITASPTIEIVENASAYDGTLDFDGTSGSTFSNIEEDFSASTTFDDSNPLWEFSIKDFFTTDTPGTTTSLPVTAIAQSTGSGSGNLSLNFQTSTGGTLTVTYLYTPIPEPGSLVLAASGLFLIGRRRQHA